MPANNKLPLILAGVEKMANKLWISPTQRCGKPTVGESKSARHWGIDVLARRAISVGDSSPASTNSIHHSATLYSGTRYCDHFSPLGVSQARTTTVGWWSLSKILYPNFGECTF